MNDPVTQNYFLALSNMAQDAAPSNAPYIVRTPSSDLTNEQALSTLASGFAKITTTTGVISTQAGIVNSDLDTTGVTAGTYTVNGANLFTVNAQGRLTAAFSPTITVTGTANKIDVSGGTGITPTITISPTYVGQTSITTLGTITTGTVTAANVVVGTTTRTLGNKLQEWISVLDYGAVGDGSTDDASAIQAAITACSEGGTVYFPKVSNCYKIASGITIPRGMRLLGSRWSVPNLTATGGSVVRASATGFDMFTITDVTAAVTFENMALGALVGSRTGAAVKITATSGSTVNSGTIFLNTAITDQGIAINAEKASNLKIFNSYLSSVYITNGILVYLGEPYNTDGGDHFIANTLLHNGTGGTGIKWVSGGGFGIVNNKFLNGAVHIDITSVSGTNFVSGQLNIVGNRFDQASSRAIYVHNLNSGDIYANATITGNVFFGNGGAPFFEAGGTGSTIYRGWLYSSNQHFTSNTPTATAVKLSAQMDGVTLGNNGFYNESVTGGTAIDINSATNVKVTSLGQTIGYTTTITGTYTALTAAEGGTGVTSLGNLTKTDDTNVTLTLGGTPTGSLIKSTSLTLGWTGQLSVARGGTGLASTTAYAVLCGGTTSTGALQSIASVGTSGQVLTSNGAGALPTFQTVPGFTAATQAEMESGSSTTVAVTPGRQQYHQSACKAWARFDGTGTPSLTASYNVSSITDNGVGDWSMNFTTSMSSATGYAVVCAGRQQVGTVSAVFGVNAYATGNVRLVAFTNDSAGSTTTVDATILNFAAFGDQ